MKNNKINPVGLKGNEINERMKELMGISSINENHSNSVVELTKVGPDGKSYAIVRENHEYYIKVTNKVSSILAEDFKYIGGLQNKKSEAYGSYAKAIKHLNLNFKSLAEAYGQGGDINVFKNDNLLTENVAGFSQYGGNGFSNEGNMEHNTPLFEWEDGPNPEDEKDYDKEEEDEDNDADYRIKKNKEEDLTEAEQAIDEMIKNPGKYTGNDKEKLGIDDDGDGVPNGADKDPKDGAIKESHKLSIIRAMENMDSIIDSLTEGTLKKKVYTLK
jgi:hypothetical protein